jgi:hypothetical protein
LFGKVNLMMGYPYSIRIIKGYGIVKKKTFQSF